MADDAMALKIVIDHLAGRRRGERQELEPADRLRFGRHPGNDVAFDTHHDLDASAWHAELRREGQGWVLIDCGSSNGTYVDGRKVARCPVDPNREVEVEFGQGGPRCRLYVGEPDAVLIPSTMVAKRDSLPMPTAQPTASSGPPPAARQTVWGRMVQPVLHPTSRKMVVIQIGVLVLTVAIAATAFFVILGMTKKDDKTEASVLTAEDIARLNAEQRKEIEKMLATEPAARIADENNRAVYLIGYTDAGGTDRPLCSGFAIAADVLATNSHCVVDIDEKEGAGLTVYAVRNRQPERRYKLMAKKRHREWRGPLSPDVGLIRLDATLEQHVKLASAAELVALQKGMRMYIYGFPGRVADPNRPDASVGDGLIGRVTTFAGDPMDPKNAFLVQHSAQTSPGASGSPIFDAKGQVIAINVGQYMEIQEQVEVDPATGKSRKVQVPAGLAPGLNIAVRIDAIEPLLADWGLSATREDREPPKETPNKTEARP
jgi:V8-like Glu-specific endopeptidase